MSVYLWKFFLEDDIDSFQQLLSEAGSTSRQSASKGHATSHLSSAAGVGSGNLDSTPSSPTLARSHTKPADPLRSSRSHFRDVVLTRGDINRRDSKGLTLLHYAASATTENGRKFALGLISHHLIDLYVQDLESGWTSLHRAFYFGNVSVAHAILEKELQNSVGQSAGSTIVQGLSLIKLKDREGNTPFDLLTTTIVDRTLVPQNLVSRFGIAARQLGDDEESEGSEGGGAAGDDSDQERTAALQPGVNIDGDELYTFGSNKNITLGLGNEDDRQFPERVQVKRPAFLLQRFYREYVQQQQQSRNTLTTPIVSLWENSKSLPAAELETVIPYVVRSRPVKIQDVQMSKFHTVVLTNDPVCNMYVCGHGLGGRLGTGSEKTQFNFTCIENAGFSRKKVVDVALGQDHTLAITARGEIFVWGSNSCGQLGLGLPKVDLSGEDVISLTPKQIFGSLKKEWIVGVAASRTHSVAHTSSSLFTWGKNEGQLGIIDANARSLEVQNTPRKVAASRFSSGIHSVSAIERATICLLDNHEVHVLANYGIVKLQFPLEGFTNYYLKTSLPPTNYDLNPNTIVKLACAGDTICALSSSGEVFATTVERKVEPSSASGSSTTNPNKIRAALPQPTRVWSLKKSHMVARDVAVDQDGSIILTTEAGSAWRRVRRSGPNTARSLHTSNRKSKDFKFMRIPGLTRVMAIRASSSGAYAAIRSDCEITRTQIKEAKQTLGEDLFELLSFKNLGEKLDDSDAEEPLPVYWKSHSPFERLSHRMVTSKDPEKELSDVLRGRPNEISSSYDILIGTTLSEIRIPAHEVIIRARSKVFNATVMAYRRGGASPTDYAHITTTDDGRPFFRFLGLDILTIFNMILYAYTDCYVPFWQRAARAGPLGHRFRQLRNELQKTSARLDMPTLEFSARNVLEAAAKSLCVDMELSFQSHELLANGDIAVQLKDAEVTVHSDILVQRCPFFEGMFQGRARGLWLAERRDALLEDTDKVSVDLEHVDLGTFKIVLRHIYTDSRESLFDAIIAKDLDEFLDTILEVLSVANELMLDQLSQACQKVIGRHVTVRNVCHLLNSVGASAVTSFKDAALEYICMNLEAMLSSHLLDELDEDLFIELDQIVRENQLVRLPHVRSGRREADLFERHPELASRIDHDRKARLDNIRLNAKYAERPGGKEALAGSYDTGFETPPKRPAMRPRSSGGPQVSPATGSPSAARQHGLQDITTGQISLSRVTSIDGASPRQATSSPLAIRPVGKPVHDAASQSSLALESLETETPLNTRPTIRRNSSIDRISNGSEQGITAASKSSITPWGSSPVSAEKLSMKDIMDQAATTRTSNISLGLAASHRQSAGPQSPQHTPRISQRERRKQQNVQLHTPQSASTVDEQPEAKMPWQKILPKNKATSQVQTSMDTQAPPPVIRRATTPQLTMRQTIANTPAQAKEKAPEEAAPSTPPAPPKRSVSSPQKAAPASSTSASGPGFAIGSSPIGITSVRHVPRPMTGSPTGGEGSRSMLDILSQQAAEKTIIQDGAAKRSLQEIQQEQEFQEWWDQESKRVMEQEAAAAARASSTPSGASTSAGGRKKGRGQEGSRGRSRGRRGKGKEKAVGGEPT